MLTFHCFVGAIARRNSIVVRLGGENQAVCETKFVCNLKKNNNNNNFIQFKDDFRVAN